MILVLILGRQRNQSKPQFGFHVVDRNKETKSHVTELQTLRGVAASLVAVSHMLRVYQLPHAVRVSLDSLLNPHAAVVLFFVLSGYVLGMSLLRSGVTPREIVKFYVRRLFRIYPAVFAVSAFSIVVIYAVGADDVTPAPSVWFVSYMSPSQMTVPNVLLSFLTLKDYLIPPVWTILTELIGSLFLPLLVWIAVCRRGLMPLLFAITLSFTILLPNARFHLDTLGFLFCFALGVGILFLRGRLDQIITDHAAVAAIMSSVTLLFFRPIWFLAITGRLQTSEFDYFASTPSIAEAISAAVLIVAILKLRGRLTWLQTGALSRLGDISYSVYLVHFPVLECLARSISPLFRLAGTSGAGATVGLLILSFGLTVAAASIIYRLVELPGIRAGKRLVSVLTNVIPVNHGPTDLRTLPHGPSVGLLGERER